MKHRRLLAAAVSFALCSGVSLFAKGGGSVACHIGVLGGITSDWIGTTDVLKNNSIAGWHAGLALELKLPAYFAVQPVVQYEMGHSNVLVGDNLSPQEFKMHTISVPVALQWGPDLGVIRPFVECVPIFNFNLGGDYRDELRGTDWYGAKDYLNPFQFGLGLGLGLEIWKIQLSARYNWIFGDWRKDVNQDNPFFWNSSSMEGVTFSVGFFF